MNPRHEAVARQLANDREALFTARSELQQHMSECATCVSDDDGPICSIGRELLNAADTAAAAVRVMGQKLPADVEGICRECGCTDERACNPPCVWVDETHTLCSACPPHYSLTEVGHDALRA